MGLYSTNDGLRYVLQTRFENRPNEFPADGFDYAKGFYDLENYLNTHVHSEVNIGASLAGDGLLTDHGKDHIEMVIQRAGILLQRRISDLSGYEIYLLLLAIHFHDVGNIYGRDKHEEKITEVMTKLGDLRLLNLDVVSQYEVAQIAMAHGGQYNGSQDTISKLGIVEYLSGKSFRPAMLAAILRFADEIADDKTRAARFLQQSDSVPAKSKVYHLYSSVLQPAAIKGETLILDYNFQIEHVEQQSSKGKVEKDGTEKIANVYLYDEILKRLKKCICELEYCNKFADGFLGLNTISARIRVYDGNIRLLYDDNIRLRPSGYPSLVNLDLESLFKGKTKILNGEEMKQHLLNESA